jgi:hypothetical protein
MGVFIGTLMLAAGFRMLGTSYPMLGADYFLLGAGFEMLDAIMKGKKANQELFLFFFDQR